MDTQQYLLQLTEALLAQADPERAKREKAYMRNKFEFIGMSAAVRRNIVKEHNAKFEKPGPDSWKELVDKLWEQPYREFQHIAIDILDKSKKLLKRDDLPFLESLVLRKSWWDTVDGIAANTFGSYFKLFPEKISRTADYINGDNFWLQRVAILFQLKYKKDLDTDLLSRYINQLSTSKEFFIQKAVGWVLREYAKTNPTWVVNFVHSNDLKPLSRREALKNIK